MSIFFHTTGTNFNKMNSLVSTPEVGVISIHLNKILNISVQISSKKA